MTRKVNVVTDDQFGVISKKIWEIQRRFKEGTLPYDKLKTYLQLIIEDKIDSQINFNSLICEQIYKKAEIKIKALNQELTIKNSALPIIYLDPLFQDNQNEIAFSGSQISISAYELVLPANFLTIFKFLSKKRDLLQMCFTESQIIEFCQTHKNLLKSNSCANFFLIKRQSNIMVLNIRLKSGKFDFTLNDINYKYVWPGEKSRRIFIAKQLN
jgi:hypothetical protein